MWEICTVAQISLETVFQCKMKRSALFYQKKKFFNSGVTSNPALATSTGKRLLRDSEKTAFSIPHFLCWSITFSVSKVDAWNFAYKLMKDCAFHQYFRALLPLLVLQILEVLRFFRPELRCVWHHLLCRSITFSVLELGRWHFIVP